MELLVVIAIIGVLAAIAIPAINVARAKARDARRVQDLKEFSAALELYYEDHQQYPVWAAGGGFQDNGGDNPLKVLVDEGYIVGALPEDPLPNKYVYYYKTDEGGYIYKGAAYLERTSNQTNVGGKDGGTTQRYFEAFAKKSDGTQLDFDPTNPDDSGWLDAQMPFAPPPTLTVNKTGAGTGTVTSDPLGINCGSICNASYNHGTSVTSTATADPGSTFAGWSGEGCTGTGTCTVTMDASKSVTATFTTNQYALTVTKSGTGTGTVTSDPPGINCGSDCSEIYNPGINVTLTATADSGSTFAGWSGGGCTGTGTCTVTMDDAKNVYVQFDIITLTVTKSGTGTVTSTPLGIDCGSDCTENYNYNTSVTLTATPDSGYYFVGWTGDCTGTAMDCTVVMDRAKSVNAQFQFLEWTGTGEFSTTSGYYVRAYASGSNTAESTLVSSIFGSGGFKIKLDIKNFKSAETYASPEYKLVLVKDGQEANLDLGSHSDWQREKVYFVSGNNLRLKLVAKATGYYGVVSTVTEEAYEPCECCLCDCTSANECCYWAWGTCSLCGIEPHNCPSGYVEMGTGCKDWGKEVTEYRYCEKYGDTSAEAKLWVENIEISMFSSTDHTLTILRRQDNETTGTVTSDPPGINCDSNWSDCSELYSSGTIVTLTATRGSSGFVSWTGDCSGSTGCPSGASSLTCTVTMDADKSVNVNFGGCVKAF